MSVTLRYSALKKSLGNEQFFQEATEQAASFNTRLKLERKMRLPFLDSQTGVAQSHTDLWHPYHHRQPGKFHGQIYSYPEKRWKKKKHYFLFSEEKVAKPSDIETGEADMHQISTVENPAVRGETEDNFPELRSETSKDRWYYEDDEYMEPPDAGEVCDDQSDISDFEETFIKKKKRKPRGRKKKEDKEKEKIDEEKEKPYACEACSARYKTRPGLAYHYTHFHNGMIENNEEPEPSPKSTAAKLEKILPVQYTTKQMAKLTSTPAPAQFAAAQPLEKKQSAKQDSDSGADNERGEDGKVQSSDYCDFCLGDAQENKKTGEAEELVSCSDCGRSGHPSCLQFTTNMTISVKKYPWQCIECKSCGLCGTSENDEQLLFCDDCDRGYHMYCLNPPLSEAPEGNWSCHLCIEEFHGGKKPAGMN